MLTMLLAAAATTAAKWLIVGKVLTVIGGGVLTVAPVIKEMTETKD